MRSSTLPLLGILGGVSGTPLDLASLLLGSSGGGSSGLRGGGSLLLGGQQSGLVSLLLLDLLQKQDTCKQQTTRSEHPRL